MQMTAKFMAALGISIIIGGCSENQFASTPPTNKKAPPTAAKTSEQTPSTDVSIPDQPKVLESGDGGAINETVKCTEGKIAFSSGANSMCPANSTAFAADDWSTLKIACCALPKVDILLIASTPVVRTSICMIDELVVGTSGNSLMCQKIDSTKYTLIEGPKACYFGSGASGSSGSGSCGAPNKFLGGLTEFGSDGCVAQVGSVVAGYSGKYCGNIPTRKLQTINGDVVPFPY